MHNQSKNQAWSVLKIIKVLKINTDFIISSDKTVKS